MDLPNYFSDAADVMRIRSATIRRDFSTHHPSAGSNREDLVAGFLEEHLPAKFGIETGLIFDSAGLLSNQADLIIVDKLNNAPLHGAHSNKLWPVESVYSLIEVKTSLNKAELIDSLHKCSKFKALSRSFAELPTQKPNLFESLFVIWAYDSVSPETLRSQLDEFLPAIPNHQRPDLIVTLSGLVIRSGSYLELTKLGQLGSPYRNTLHAEHGPDLSHLLPLADLSDLGEDSLFAWFIWFDSFLRNAGPRVTIPVNYIPSNWVARYSKP